MKRVAVFVATTDGPVRIERITRERAPQSMVCLKRTSTVLPISAAYDSFVRPGSGVIERTLGPFEEGAFRLDVSAPIDSGLSWQLGVFVAHAVAKNGAQAVLSPEDQADCILWLTGAVDADLRVGAVDHVAEKLHASAGAFARWAGKAVTVILPESAEGLIDNLPDDVHTMAVASARDALTAVDLAITTHPPMILPPKPARRIPSPTVAVAFGFFVLAFLLITDRFMRPPPVLKAPAAMAKSQESRELAPPVPARLAVMERRAPAGHTCAEVQFGKIAAAETPVSDPVSNLQGLCGLGLVVDNARPQFVTVVLDVLSGELLFGTDRPAALAGDVPFTGRQEWAIDLPKRMQQPFEIRAAALAADHPTATADLKTPGVAVATVQHRVLP